MASVQVLTRKTGRVYRVQLMRHGRRISQVFSKRKDADTFLSEITRGGSLADALTCSSLSTITLSETIRTYLDQYKGRDTSMPHRLGWWAERLGSKTMGNIQRQDVKAALEVLKKDEKSPATMNRYQVALSTMYRWFNNEHDTDHNPTSKISMQTENNGRTRFLSDDELLRLMAAAKANKWQRMHLLVHMAISTGARRSELINLKWSDVDFQRKTAHLVHTKNGSQRVLTLTNAVIQELMPFRQVGDVHLFPHTGMLHGPFQYFDHHWKSCLIEAEITNFRFHDLRHTCASMLAKNGATLLEIAEHLGHKTLGMVKRYAHLCIHHKAALTERIFGGIAL